MLFRHRNGQKSPMGSVTVHNVQPPRQQSAGAPYQQSPTNEQATNGIANHRPTLQRAQTVGATPPNGQEQSRKFSLFNNAIELARKSSNSYIPDTFKLPFELSFEVNFFNNVEAAQSYLIYLLIQFFLNKFNSPLPCPERFSL